MRMAELAATTNLPVATLKYYVREGLLPPGEATSRTSATYGARHVARARLVRALTEVGGLSIAAARRVLEALDTPAAGPVELMRVAADAVPLPASPAQEDDRARAWVAARGWVVDPDDPLIGSLETAWRACEDAGIAVDEELLDGYADDVLNLARRDLATVPAEPGGAVRQVVLGTVLLDPVLLVLRRLAHRQVAAGAAPQGAATPRPITARGRSTAGCGTSAP